MAPPRASRTGRPPRSDVRRQDRLARLGVARLVKPPTALVACFAALVTLAGTACDSSDGSAATDELADIVSAPTQRSESVDTDTREALQYFETVGLPPGGLMGSMIGADRLIGGCIEHLGFPVENADIAEESGQYTFTVGEQRDRFGAVADACRDGLAAQGVLFENSIESRRILFDALVEAHECLVENSFESPQPPTFDSFNLGPDQWDPWQNLTGPSGHPYPDARARSAVALQQYFSSLEVCPRP